jgi:hypothetical protein
MAILAAREKLPADIAPLSHPPHNRQPMAAEYPERGDAQDGQNSYGYL